MFGRFPLGASPYVIFCASDDLACQRRATFGGEDEHTLVIAEMPSHNHDYGGQVGVHNPGSGGFGFGSNVYNWTFPYSTLQSGGGQAHNNMPPFLALNYIIALEGIFPPRP